MSKNKYKTSPLIIGNWKMNGNFLKNALLLKDILVGISKLQVNDGDSKVNAANIVVCVPYPYLSQCQDLLSDTALSWGAQNVSHNTDGQFSGEVSVSMLADFGCSYVLIGHSERRIHHLETNELIAKKLTAVANYNKIYNTDGRVIIPVLCIGETLSERKSGQTNNILYDQINTALHEFPIEQFNNLVIAYEPVWAIGTGQTAAESQVQEVHAYLRDYLRNHICVRPHMRLSHDVPIIYGGSLKPENAAALFNLPAVDGGLIGGASLIAQDFLAIAGINLNIN